MMSQRMTHFNLTTKEHLSQRLGTFNGPEKRHAILRTFDKSACVFRQVWLKHGAERVVHGLPVTFPARQQQQHTSAKGVGQVLSCFASGTDTLTTLQRLIKQCISFPFPSCPTLRQILERPVGTQAKAMPQSSKTTVRKTPSSKHSNCQFKI